LTGRGNITTSGCEPHSKGVNAYFLCKKLSNIGGALASLLNQLQRLHPQANLPNLNTLLDPQPAEGFPLAATMFTFFFQF
jgi:hypothetical protein